MTSSHDPQIFSEVYITLMNNVGRLVRGGGAVCVDVCVGVCKSS